MVCINRRVTILPRLMKVKFVSQVRRTSKLQGLTTQFNGHTESTFAENSYTSVRGYSDILIDKCPVRKRGGTGGESKVIDVVRYHRIISTTISGYALFLNSFNCIFPALIRGGDPRSGVWGHSLAGAFEAQAPTTLCLFPPLCVALNCKLF